MALCKVTFHATAGSTVVFTVINYAESSYDFGMLGTLDGTAMSTSYSDISTGVAKSFSGSQSANTQTYSYSISSTGNHYVYVKYKKDGSVNNNNDSFQFKISSGLTTTSSITVSYGGTISSLPTATRSGYTFKGWFTSTSGGTQLTTLTSITSNRTYYAQWKENPTTYTCWCCGASSSSSTCSTCASYGSCAACLKCNLHCTCAGYGGCACYGSSSLYDGIHCYTCYSAAAHCETCGACLIHGCAHL